MWWASHIPNKHSWRLCSGISPCCSETTNKSQRRNNQRENEFRERDPGMQSERRWENVTGNSFMVGWWVGEKVDKAETSDILKRYTKSFISYIHYVGDPIRKCISLKRVWVMGNNLISLWGLLFHCLSRFYRVCLGQHSGDLTICCYEL